MTEAAPKREWPWWAQSAILTFIGIFCIAGTLMTQERTWLSDVNLILAGACLYGAFFAFMMRNPSRWKLSAKGEASLKADMERVFRSKLREIAMQEGFAEPLWNDFDKSITLTKSPNTTKH